MTEGENGRSSSNHSGTTVGGGVKPKLHAKKPSSFSSSCGGVGFDFRSGVAGAPGCGRG